MNVNLKQRFQEILEDNRILEAELMSRHTTFRIGGPADFFLVPENADEIKKIIAVCKEKNVPYFILGNGSNLLVSDKGYQGVVVQLYRNFGQIRVEDEPDPCPGRSSFIWNCCSCKRGIADWL